MQESQKLTVRKGNDMTDLSIQAQLNKPVLCDDERQRCEIWTRVMGYHRPTCSFNTGKKGEFSERTYFREDKTARSIYGTQTS